jgi:hypothetical protein
LRHKSKNETDRREESNLWWLVWTAAPSSRAAPRHSKLRICHMSTFLHPPCLALTHSSSIVVNLSCACFTTPWTTRLGLVTEGRDMRRWGARLACAVATCEGNHLVLHEVGNGDGGEQAPATGDGAPHGHTSWLRGGLLTTTSRPAFLALELTTMLGWANAGCGGVKKSRAEARGSTRAGPSCRRWINITISHFIVMLSIRSSES